MSKAMQLQKSVLQDIVSMLDDTDAMNKIQIFLQRLKKEKAVEEEMTAAEKDEIKEI